MEPTTPGCVRARVDWARRRGHPEYLWPDVAIARWRTALRGVEGAVRAVLAGSGAGGDALIAPEQDEPDPDAARAVGVAAFTSGLGPLLGRWLEEGTLPPTMQGAGVLAEHLHHGRLRWERMRRMLEEALSSLLDAGLNPIVLKGMQTGAAYFPEPGARPASDIDLAVAPAQLPLAESALARLGWRLKRRRSDPPGSEWVPAEPQLLRSLELTHAENPVAIDLHGGIDRSFFGVRRLRFGDGPFTTAACLPDFAGARRLSQPWQFVFLAAHASEELHRLQLLRLVELVLVARADLEPGGWTAVRELTRELDAARFLLPAIELAERLVPGSMDAAWLEEDLRPAAPRRMRHALTGLRPSDAQRLEGLSLRDRFLFAQGPAELTRRVAFLLWPQRSRRVSAVYAERIWRLLRGRVRLGPVVD